MVEDSLSAKLSPSKISRYSVWGPVPHTFYSVPRRATAMADFS